MGSSQNSLGVNHDQNKTSYCCAFCC
jgi:hypothetical protein